MSPLNWFRKEMPFQGLIGFGGGATGLTYVGGAGAIDASGGTTSTFSDPAGSWKAHVFTSTGSFVVNSGSGDIEYLVIAGGAGGPAGQSASKGSPSSLALPSAITSTGGGAGGYDAYTSPGPFPTIKDGGSGGGDYDAEHTGRGNTPPVSPPQGTDAGDGNGSRAAGGGGGGTCGPGNYEGGDGGSGIIVVRYAT